MSVAKGYRIASTPPPCTRYLCSSTLLRVCTTLPASSILCHQRTRKSHQPLLATNASSDVSKSQSLRSRHNTERIRVSHTTLPSLNTDHVIAVGEDTEGFGFGDTPLETLVDVFLPVCFGEVRFSFGEEKGVDAAVKMGVLSRDVR